MKKTASVISILAIFSITLACSNAQPTPTPPPPSPKATNVSPPTVIVVITNTPEPALPPTAEPDKNGYVIYDDGEDILSIDPGSGESTVLVSRKELQTILAKDRSAESYTYGYEKPISISFSPDYSKALVTICADIDARFRCLFGDYMYTLADKSGVKLPVPPDAYGVYWQWSPDSSKLAGAAWTYDRAIYIPAAFYAVNSDGTNLTPLGPIVNDRWQFAWNPKSGAIHPLSYVVNFQFVFTDKSKPEDISLPGVNENDRIECLAFSPDGGRVAFTTRRNAPKNRQWVYLANSNFSEVTQLTEYDIDPRYFCKMIWSPDGRFVHLRFEYDARVETGEEISGNEPRKDKLVNIETGSLLDTPRDLLVCGWTPENNLVYETKTQDGGVQILSPGTNSPIAIPSGLRSTVSHCPVTWLGGR